MIADNQKKFVEKLLARRGFDKATWVDSEHEEIIDVHAKTTGRGPKRTLLLRIILEPPVVGVEILRNLVKARDSGEFSDAILIGGERYTYAARREAKEKNVELLHRRFLSIDLFQHSLVPEHDIIDEKEVEKLERQYGISRKQLPKIKAGDPAAKAIGARPGDVIRIVRKSETAGQHVVYRICVA